METHFTTTATIESLSDYLEAPSTKSGLDMLLREGNFKIILQWVCKHIEGSATEMTDKVCTRSSRLNMIWVFYVSFVVHERRALLSCLAQLVLLTKYFVEKLC